LRNHWPQRSSPSIGGLAAVVAKAHSELVNPEKSLAATIPPEGTGRPEQTFRYAPPSDLTFSGTTERRTR
jgi:hypothetical protein